MAMVRLGGPIPVVIKDAMILVAHGLPGALITSSLNNRHMKKALIAKDLKISQRTQTALNVKPQPNSPLTRRVLIVRDLSSLNSQYMKKALIVKSPSRSSPLSALNVSSRVSSPFMRRAPTVKSLNFSRIQALLNGESLNTPPTMDSLMRELLIPKQGTPQIAKVVCPILTVDMT
ncbi:hypothetical protein ACI68E_001641 [Malassezia pachydermatis]